MSQLDYASDLVLELMRPLKKLQVLYNYVAHINKSVNRAFVYAAFNLWNKLSVDVRSSKSLQEFRKQMYLAYE